MVVGRITTGLVVCRRVVGMHLVARMHVVVSVFRDDCRRIPPLTIRAQHGRRHRAPDGEQDGQQDDDEEAEVFHAS